MRTPLSTETTETLTSATGSAEMEETGSRVWRTGSEGVPSAGSCLDSDGSSAAVTLQARRRLLMMYPPSESGSTRRRRRRSISGGCWVLLVDGALGGGGGGGGGDLTPKVSTRGGGWPFTAADVLNTAPVQLNNAVE